MTIQLKAIFIEKPNQRLYSKADLIGLKIQPDFIKKLANQLALSYEKNNLSEGNVCFANSISVRPEYRTTFTKADVIHYICRQISTDYFELKKVEAYYPIDVANFFV